MNGGLFSHKNVVVLSGNLHFPLYELILAHPALYFQIENLCGVKMQVLAAFFEGKSCILA
ncbi:hypothetical protein EBZ39_18210 [bacterium]|nr:hypothetical protein [bacterium]